MIFVIGRKNIGKAERRFDRLGESYYEVGQVIKVPQGTNIRVVYK